jgi:hypothetical protein
MEGNSPPPSYLRVADAIPASPILDTAIAFAIQI